MWQCMECGFPVREDIPDLEDDYPELTCGNCGSDDLDIYIAQDYPTVHAVVKKHAPDLYEKLGPGNAQGLHDAITGETTKHDPYCDCGICKYCKGDEDKYGNSPQKFEIIALSVAINQQISIVCTDCGDHKWETVGSRSDTPVQDFARELWKTGWIVKDDMALCPNCHEEERND